jgi:hypothetical protein
MCTGHAPYRAKSCVAVLRQVCEAEPASLRANRPELPAWLEGIVHRLHAKDPAERFQSATDVAALLEGCLAHVQQPDNRPLPPLAVELGRPFQARQRPPGRRQRNWVAAAAATGVLGMVVLLLLPRPGVKEDAEAHRSGATSAAGERATTEAAGPSDEEFQEGANQLHARLRGLADALTAPAPGEGPALEPAFEDVRLRAEYLRRQLGPAAPGPDPIEGQVESIRRRLEVLRQQIGRLAE